MPRCKDGLTRHFVNILTMRRPRWSGRAGYSSSQGESLSAHSIRILARDSIHHSTNAST